MNKIIQDALYKASHCEDPVVRKKANSLAEDAYSIEDDNSEYAISLAEDALRLIWKWEHRNLSPDFKDFVPGYINASNGSIANPSAHKLEVTSDFIPIKPGEKIYFGFPGGEFPDGSDTTESDISPWRAVGFYTANKTFIQPRLGGLGKDPLITAIPANAAYIRISYRTWGNTKTPIFKYEPKQ